MYFLFRVGYSRFMAERYRRRGEGWSKKIDISLLYQMDREAESLQKLATELADARIKGIANRFTYLLALANGDLEIGRAHV